MDKVGQRAPIVQTHARPVGIEDAHNVSVHAMIAVIRHGHGFRIAFSFVVHSPRSDGVYMSPVSFWLGRDFRIAVAFARGSQEKFGLFSQRESKSIMSTESAHLQRLDGHLQVIHGARGRGKMENVIDRPRNVYVVGNVRARESKTRIFVQVADVGVRAGYEVIERQNVPALGDQPVAKMRPQKPGAAGYHSTHAYSCW